MKESTGSHALTVSFRNRDGVWCTGRLVLPAVNSVPSSERHEGIEVGAGVVLGGLTDWHVHLHLIDSDALAATPIARVHDLGGVPDDLRERAGDEAKSLVEVRYAGAFLTPPGGYPSDRSWAPQGSFREVTDEADGKAAVAAMRRAGAHAIKVSSNADAGPVFDAAVFRAIVRASREAGMPVVAHAEGAGEAVRVARLGAQMLAHAPFTERLTGTELAELAATTTWISTLDIHGWGAYGREHEIAVANVAGFVQRGGRLRYGTDMGNGPTVTGVNPRELDSLAAAGLDSEQLIAAMTPRDPLSPRATLIWVPRNEQGALDLGAARRLPPGSRMVLTDRDRLPPDRTA